jgi:hypothetical protein
MEKIKSLILVTTISLIMVGCASIPKEEELQQLNSTQASELLTGHTLTYKADWGRWAEYHKDGSTGVSKAWGNWGKDVATSEYTINQDGEACWVYTGEADWSQPDEKYCSLFYTDESGAYYGKGTVNTNKPERVGKWRKFEIIEGDEYGLTEN